MKALEREAGYVLVTTAACLFVLVGFAVLAVDVGLWYSQRTSAQRAADAGALAGAFQFVETPNATELQIKDRAIAAAESNNVMGQSVEVDYADVDVELAERRVTVRVRHTARSFFAAALFGDQVGIAAAATAEASNRSTAAWCAKPWILPSTALVPDGQSLCSPCPTDVDGVTTNPLFDAALAEWELVQYAGSGPLFDPGGEAGKWIHEIKPQNPAQALAPSNFYAIQVGGVGADIYRENIDGCAHSAVSCGDAYSVETGNMVGPTAQGVNDLLGFAPDEYAYYDDTRGHLFYPAGNWSMTVATSPQKTAVPVWDICSDPDWGPGGTLSGESGVGHCPADDIPSGTNFTYPIDAFAEVFVMGLGGGNAVEVRILQILFECGEGTGPGETPDLQAGPLSVPVRLVHREAFGD